MAWQRLGYNRSATVGEKEIVMYEAYFDAIVVGSGFGGSVMAYRPSEGGLRVCLLERGKAYPPNSFPRSPYRMPGDFWDPDEGLYGLYDFWSFHRIHALVASGLVHDQAAFSVMDRCS